jgi:hypothetical protein
MTTQVIKFGICADNKDPHSAGRIRVVFDKDLSEIFRENSNAASVLAEIDNNYQQKYGISAYTPWFIGSNREISDPYVVEPVMPKHLHVIPKIGESVKVIFYNIDSENSPKEYFGPQISSKDNLSFENSRSGRAFSDVSNTRRDKIDLSSNNFIPREEDVGLIGRGNSDFILSNHSATIRAGHKNFNDNSLNRSQSFIQTSSFPNKVKNKREKQERAFTPQRKISNVIEIDFSNNENLIQGNLKIYKVSNLNTNNFTADKSLEIENSIGNMTINTNSKQQLISFLQKFFNDLDKRTINLSSNNTIENGTKFLEYSFQDDRIIDNGSKFFDPFLYAIREKETKKKSLNQEILQNIKNLLRPIEKLPQERIISEEVNIQNLENEKQNGILAYSDKIYLLSREHNINFQDYLNNYGIPQENIDLLESETEPILNGNKMLSLLLKIIKVIEIHGHSKDGPNTISENVKDEIKEMKNELNKKVNEDLSGGPNILNQYIRH